MGDNPFAKPTVERRLLACEVINEVHVPRGQARKPCTEHHDPLASSYPRVPLNLGQSAHSAPAHISDGHSGAGESDVFQQI